MKALVLTAYNTLELLDVPTPMPGPGEVLIRVRACGICGSDVHGMDGSTGRRQPPIIMGHEASGVIAALGDGVTDWAAGDRVTFDSTIYCGACAYCVEGRINLCNNRRVLGVSCDEYRQNGAMAEYVAVPSRIVHRLPDALSFEHAAMVEPVSVAIHAASHASYVPIDTAVIVGAGMIGLLILDVLKMRSYGLVVVTDVDESRLERARAMGAHITINPTACNVVDDLRHRTRGLGVNVAFDAVGTPESFNTAANSVKKGGAVVLVGNVSARVDLPLQRIVTQEISLFGSCASAGEYPACLKLMSKGHIDVQPLISAVAPLSDGPAWFERLHRRETGLMKVILQP